MNLSFIWQFLSYFGDIAYWLGFSISFLLVYPFLEKKDKKKTKWIIYKLIPTVLITFLIVISLKFLLAPRACISLECLLTSSFPSGHAAIAFASAMVIVANLRKKPYLLFFCLAILVAISRVILGVHTIEDIVVGSALGIGIGYGVILTKKIKLNWFYRRKLVHLSALSILLIENFFGKYFALSIVILASALYIISGLLRKRRLVFPFIQTITRACIEPKKAKFLPSLKDFLGITKRTFFATPLYFAAGIFTLLLLFPKMAFYFGVIAVIVGDSMAGIFGKKFGKRKIFYNYKKTLEGSMACFFSIFLPYLLLTNFLTAFLLALFATFIESLFNKYENFILPISVGIVSLFV